jgi:hypothetical protein
MRCKPFCHFCLLADDKFWLSSLFTNRKINIGTDMGGKSVQTFFFLAFSYCNLFFKKSTNMKQRWQTILPPKKILPISPSLPWGYRFISLAWVTNQITAGLFLTRIIQSLYYAPAGRYDSADRGRSIIHLHLHSTTIHQWWWLLVERSANRQKNYKKSADHINSDKIKLYTKFIYRLKFVV